MSHNVTVFEPYEFKIGQEICIAAGPRKGDWRVTGITDKTVKLTCPISNREFEWKRFCYVVEQRTQDKWPAAD